MQLLEDTMEGYKPKPSPPGKPIPPTSGTALKPPSVLEQMRERVDRAAQMEKRWAELTGYVRGRMDEHQSGHPCWYAFGEVLSEMARLEVNDGDH
jgi:hypothetical protein